ncbi:MAG TPA: flagellar hook protein FlgE [Stenomitos sp.]
MLRSLSSGVSGLRNQQVRLDVIGNNIANVNTVGYKAHRVNFQEQFSQTLRGGSAPNGSLGGTNPTQVGLGVTVGSIDLMMGQGSLNPTGKNTDLAISGEGFFVISDGKQQVYTRDGAFDFDRSGNLVKISNGFRVMGWNAQMQPDGSAAVDTSRAPEALVVPAGTTLNPQMTSFIKMGSNLEQQSVDGTIARSSVTMYDSAGNVHKGAITFTKNGTNTWDVAFTPDNAGDFSGGPYNLGKITFDDKGVLATNTMPTPSLHLDPATVGAFSPLDITIDVGTIGKTDGLTQFSDPKSDASTKFFNQTAVMVDQNGYSSGALSGVSIGSDGKMIGNFTNGRTRILGQVAMATFTNPVGMAVNGDNIFSATPNSGEPQVGIAGSGSRGLIAPGSLENSNVDLAQSFSDLIVAQRGLQSNSKIITTSDEVLQELMSLKR